MAVCKLDKFTITRGADNEFYFTIKANNSLLPLVLDPTDVITAKLIRLTDNSTIDLEKTLTHVDRLNGKVKLFITEAESNSLLTERGQAEHGYYLKPVYSLLIEATTVVSGYFTARLSKVYVG